MTDPIAIERNDARLLRGYLQNIVPTFTNVPKGMDPTFYHTLSYDGDVAEGDRLRGLIARLDACLAGDSDTESKDA